MTRKLQYGFSLLEMMAATGVILIVTGIVMTGMGQMIYTNGTIANRSEMHAGVRSATELLQQEIGQAGKVSLGSLGANELCMPRWPKAPRRRFRFPSIRPREWRRPCIPVKY